MSAELTVNNAAVSAELNRKIKNCLYLIGNMALEGAVESISGTYTPANKAVDTGRLRASLSFVTPYPSISGQSYVSGPVQPGDMIAPTAEPNTVIIGTNVEYAEFVHNGTVKMAARPFLIEGIEKQRDKIKEYLDAILGDGNYSINEIL